MYRLVSNLQVGKKNFASIEWDFENQISNAQIETVTCYTAPVFLNVVPGYFSSEGDEQGVPNYFSTSSRLLAAFLQM